MEEKELLSEEMLEKIMTPRDSDGSTGYVVEEKNDVVIDKTGMETKKIFNIWIGFFR